MANLSELESTRNSVQVEDKSYEMPPKEGFVVAHFLTVADVARSAQFYETVFGGKILSKGDDTGAPAYIRIANYVAAGEPGRRADAGQATVTLSVPDPNHINSFMNIRVADIQACYELWKSRGAEFYYAADTEVWGDSVLYPRSGWVHYRSRAEHGPCVRLGWRVAVRGACCRTRVVGGEKQIPPLRCGMTARKAKATAKARAKANARARAKAKAKADSSAVLRNDSQKSKGNGRTASNGVV